MGDANEKLSKPESENARVRVFVSYAVSDSGFVDKLISDLRKQGIEVLRPSEANQPGEPIIEGIARAIEESDIVLAIVSHASEQSSWVATETAIAGASAVENKDKVIIPVILERGTRIPLVLQSRVWSDFSDVESYSRSLEKLIRAIHQHAKVRLAQNDAGQQITVETTNFDKLLEDRYRLLEQELQAQKHLLEIEARRRTTEMAEQAATQISTVGGIAAGTLVAALALYSGASLGSTGQWLALAAPALAVLASSVFKFLYSRFKYIGYNRYLEFQVDATRKELEKQTVANREELSRGLK